MRENVKKHKNLWKKKNFPFTEHVRCVFLPLLKEHANQPKGSEVKSGQRQHPKPATTNAQEHLLSVRHTKLSPRSPSQPLMSLGTAQSQGQPPKPKC